MAAVVVSEPVEMKSNPRGSALAEADDRPSFSYRYVLVSPARNEAAYLRETARSVISQTILPVKWVIVSDGSTDATDQIAQACARDHAWIEFVRMPERSERHFAGKVHAFNAGYSRLAQLEYDVVGNLDADVSFGPDYIEYLLGKFAQNPRLGVAGTNRWEGSLMYDYRFTSAEDVAGACQLFRRQCYETIGGYKAIKGGGIDLVALLSARMHGWETRSYTERVLVHHRPTGTATANPWMVHFKHGRNDYMFGGHPLWEMFRAGYRMVKRPFLIGGLLLLAGYWGSMLRGVERPLSRELIRFRRDEQKARLKTFLRSAIWPRREGRS